MRELPACPVCSAALSRERALGDAYLIDEPHSRCTIDVSCAGCLSAVRFETETREEAPVTSEVLAPGAVVTRFRDSVLAMRERGELEAAIPALLADPAQGLLVGVPEIAKEILALGVRSVRVAKNSYAIPGWYSMVWGGESPWRFDRFPDHIDDAQKKTALRDGEFGGFIVAEHGSRILVLALQKFTVSGFYSGKARLALPRVAARRLPSHPGFLATWEQLVPDRARRAL